MPNFYSPNGNFEIWGEKPDGYFTAEEWAELHPQPPVTEPTLDELKSAKRNEIANARYEAERAGMLFGGVVVKTDDISQSKITGAVLSALEDPEYSIADWKVNDGTFIVLSNAQILELGRALRNFVQAQFTKERMLSALIDTATTREEVEAISWDMEV